jgi:hypothetical protein
MKNNVFNRARTALIATALLSVCALSHAQTFPDRELRCGWHD